MRMTAQKTIEKEVQLDKVLNPYLDSKGKSTRQAYSSCLRRFKEYYGNPFKEFINEIETQQEVNKDLPLSQRVRPGEEAIRGFIEWHKTKGYSPKATRQSIAAVQNALKYFGISLSTDFIKLPPNRTLKENEKHRWTLEEVKAFVDSADYLRDKAFIMVAFQSGLGIGDIVDLNYGDIRREFEEGIQPLRIHTYRKKTGVELKTFIGRDANHYLRQYLKSRPGIKSEDPLFTKLGSEKRVTIGALQKKLKDYASKVDFLFEDDVNNGYNPARPHSLRSAFRSRLTGKMDNTLIEFFMGHSIGDQVKTYINMPDDELRELYANYEHLLAIEKTSKEEEVEKGPAPLPEDTVKDIENLKATVLDLSQRNTVYEVELKGLRTKHEALRTKHEEQARAIGDLQEAMNLFFINPELAKRRRIKK
jgi:integrase/recombinase XerD